MNEQMLRDLVDDVRAGRLARRDFIAHMVALGVGVLLLTRGVQPAPTEAYVPLWTRPLIAGDALAFYLGKLVWPVSLGIDYGRTPSVVLHHWWGYMTWLIPLALVAGVWLMRRRAPWLAASAMIFMAALLPVLGFFPFIFQTYSTVADRYLYLAMLGPALGLAFLLSQMGRFVAVWGACAVLLLMLGFQSSVQVVYWSDSVALFDHTLVVNPQSWVSYYNLGHIADTKHDPNLAIEYYQHSIRLNPNRPEAHMNLGTDFSRSGRTAESVTEYQQALRLDPHNPANHLNLGVALLIQGHREACIAEVQEALRLKPGFLLAQKVLTIAQQEQRGK